MFDYLRNSDTSKIICSNSSDGQTSLQPEDLCPSYNYRELIEQLSIDRLPSVLSTRGHGFESRMDRLLTNL